jgi:hypothetical protein
MNKKECPPLHSVEADVKVEYDPETKTMHVCFVWHEPVNRITVPIEFKPYEPNTASPGKTDDPV